MNSYIYIYIIYICIHIYIDIYIYIYSISNFWLEHERRSATWDIKHEKHEDFGKKVVIYYRVQSYSIMLERSVTLAESAESPKMLLVFRSHCRMHIRQSNRKRPADKDVFLLNMEDFHFKVELWVNYWRSSLVKHVQAMILSTFILQESACRKWAQPRSAWAAEPFRLASRPCQWTMWHESLRSPTSILATGTGWVWYPMTDPNGAAIY